MCRSTLHKGEVHSEKKPAVRFSGEWLYIIFLWLVQCPVWGWYWIFWHQFKISELSYILARKWFAMYYSRVSFVSTFLGPTAEVFGYSLRYRQCAYSSTVVLFQFTESKEHAVCDLSSVRPEKSQSRKLPSLIRRLVHMETGQREQAVP